MLGTVRAKLTGVSSLACCRVRTRSHTSCISEAEKYEKTLYKGPKKVSLAALRPSGRAQGEQELAERNSELNIELSPRPSPLASPGLVCLHFSLTPS